MFGGLWESLTRLGKSSTTTLSETLISRETTFWLGLKPNNMTFANDLIYALLRALCPDDHVIRHALSSINFAGEIDTQSVVSVHRMNLADQGRTLSKAQADNTRMMVDLAVGYYQTTLERDDPEAYLVFLKWRRLSAEKGSLPSEVQWIVLMLEAENESNYSSKVFLRRLRRIQDAAEKLSSQSPDKSHAEIFWKKFKLSGWTWTSAKRNKIFRKKAIFYPGGHDKNLILSGAFEMNRRRH